MKQTIIRILTGLIIIAIGVGALLGALNIFPFWDTFKEWWPLLVILGGVFVWLGDWRRNYIWGIVLIIVGALLQLKELGQLDFNFFSLIVPILVIAAGLSILLHTKNRTAIKSGTKDADDISVIFSGSETKNVSKNYQGGKITAIFGGAVLDLRDAKLTKDATLDVFLLCGGLELKVPRDWKVVSKVAPIAGGVENKSEGSENQTGPVLTLTGSATLGGVEIKT
jgi:predicted membrane protein